MRVVTARPLVGLVDRRTGCYEHTTVIEHLIKGQTISFVFLYMLASLLGDELVVCSETSVRHDRYASRMMLVWRFDSIML